ncbi:DUF2029 domain-containing protein [bacterium]|nr:DUF2029 domain-containing protein [bacterium]MCB2179162.1 DUF2029 domain-containing protein [bacterium]
MQNSKKNWLGIVLLIPLLAAFILLAVQFTRGEPLFDFTAFWLSGKLSLEGKDPYDSADWIPEYAPFELGLADNQTFLYPKPILPLFIPFGLLDLHTASLLWVLLTQILVFTAIWLILRTWPQPRLLPAVLFFISIVLSRSYLVTLNLGQLGGVFLLLLALPITLWRKESWFWGGLILSLMALKPQLGLPIIGLASIWFLRKRCWPYFYGLISGGALMLVIGWLLDPAWIGNFLQIGTGKVAATFGFHPTLWGLSGYLCHLDANCAVLWGGMVMLIFLASFIWIVLQRRVPLSAEQVLGFATLYGLLLTPYLWIYDQVLILLPLAVAVGLLLEKSRSWLFPAVLPLTVSLLSLLMLQVAEVINRDVYSVVVPLVCLVILGFTSFRKPTPNVRGAA